MSYTIQDAIAYVQEGIFKRIRDENQGEFSKEDFDDVFYSIMNDECDDFSTHLEEDSVQELILEYGLKKAIQLLISNNSGPLEDAPDLETMLFFILQEKIYLCTNFASYTQYCNENSQ
jgi:hypothetical protein